MEVEKLHKVRCKDYESYTKKKTLYCDFCGLQNYCKKVYWIFQGGNLRF
jgi:hypothetical protein